MAFDWLAGLRRVVRNSLLNRGSTTKTGLPSNRCRRRSVRLASNPEVYESRTLLSGISPGPEFKVNTFTANDQDSCEVAVDASGNYVIVWESMQQDGDGFGIFGQRYNASGVPSGSEFQVNTHTTGHQLHPSVAMDANGDFVVAWESNPQDGSQYGVYAQRYNFAGVPQGGEFQVNTYTSSHQREVSVAMNAGGNFVISWTSHSQDGSGYGIYAQRYNPAGAPEGAEFHVTTYTTQNQRNSEVAIDTAGDFVVTWESRFQDGSEYGVYAQRFDAAGNAVGPEFRVNTETTGAQGLPVVEMSIGGDFVIAWESFGQDGSDKGVYAQRYSADGTPLGGEFRVNTHTSADQQRVSVGIDAAGNFVIAWDSETADAGILEVFAQRYDSNGVPLGSEFQVNVYTTSYQFDPAVAIDLDGNFVVAWRSDYQDGWQDGIYARRFERQFQKLPSAGDEFVVNTYTTGNQTHSEVATDGDGNFVIVWESFGQDGDAYGIFGQRYSEGGSPLGSEFQISTTTTSNQRLPSIAMNRDGDFVVVWESSTQDGSDYGVFGQRFDRMGLPVGGEFQINTYTTGAQRLASVAMDAVGNFVVSWRSQDQDGSDQGIFAQRFDNLGIPLGSEFQVNTFTTGSQTFVTVGMNGAGEFVIAWESADQDGDGTGIYAQRFDPIGSTVGSEFRVNTSTVNNQSGEPGVDVDEAGNFVIAWYSYDAVNELDPNREAEVYFQRFDASGTPQGGEYRVNRYRTEVQDLPTVAYDASGNFVVVWDSVDEDGDGFGSYVRRFNSRGEPISEIVQLNTYTTGHQDFPIVAVDSDGDFVVTWRSSVQDGNGYAVVARRFLTHRADDVGVNRGAKFYLDSNHSDSWDGAVADTLVSFGAVTDRPLVGDWNGDGYTDLGVWRNGTFLLDTNGNGKWDGPSIDGLFRFGISTDLPLAGDWNGDGKDEIGVWRAGKFYLDLDGNGLWNSAADGIVKFGGVFDTPLVGDWNGDGQDDVGVWRAGRFYLDLDGNGLWNSGVDGIFKFGAVTDSPLIGDYNGDGVDDLGVWRSGVFYQDADGNRAWNAGIDRIIKFGATSDLPLIGSWREKEQLMNSVVPMLASQFAASDTSDEVATTVGENASPLASQLAMPLKKKRSDEGV